MHSIGEAIVDGKDKLVAVTVETFEDVKEAVEQKFAKKKAVPEKKAVVKKVAAIKKAAKKTGKKIAPKKKKK
jgi:hypothetical protein